MNKIDVIATDQCTDTLNRESPDITKAPSGGPLNQHSLSSMLDLQSCRENQLRKNRRECAINVAKLFRIKQGDTSARAILLT